MQKIEQLKQQVASYKGSADELHKQLEEEKQVKEMLLKLVSGLEEKVNVLTKQQEEKQQKLATAIEKQEELLNNLTTLNQELVRKIEQIQSQPQRHVEDNAALQPDEEAEVRICALRVDVR